jgi:hypothetical protein
MQTAQIFKIIERKHPPQQQNGMRDSETGGIIASRRRP